MWSVPPHVVMEARIACKQQVRAFINPGTTLLSNPLLLPVHILEPVVRDGDTVRPQFAGYLFLGYQQLADLIEDGTPGASVAVPQRLNACPGSLASQANRDN